MDDTDPDDSWSVLRARVPGVRRELVPWGSGQVEVFVAGTDGPPVVFMPPFNIGAGFFAAQFAELASSHRVLAIHHPGVGATTAADDVTLPGIARMHHDVLDTLGVPFPVHVVGASVGGILAQHFALSHPGDTASLTIVCGSYKYANRKGEINQLAQVVAEDLAGVPCTAEERAEFTRLLLSCESMDPRIGLRYLDFFAAEPDLRDRLGGIKSPTLVVQGRRDTVIPLKTAHLLHALIEDAEYAELPDAGHFPCVTHPDVVNALLTRFLSGAQEGPRS